MGVYVVTTYDSHEPPKQAASLSFFHCVAGGENCSSLGTLAKRD